MVSQRVERIAERGECRDAVDQRLTLWLEQAGALAFPVPNRWSVAPSLNAWLAAVEPGGIVLSGGEDLGESPERDDTERALLRFAIAWRLPVLGLCRGLQMLSVFAGGALERLPGHAGCRHGLRVEAGSGFSSDVNSFHAWGLRACPPGYEALARAPDGSIEAIRHGSLPWEGWMWHPEREPAFTANDLVRLRSLLESGPAGGTIAARTA